MLEGQAIAPAFCRHKFRGGYLDCFAQIENHIAPALQRAIGLNLEKQVPHLFGSKFKLLQKTLADERFWKHREHVKPIVDELRLFAELRGLIGHGIIVEASLEGQPAISIDAPGERSWEHRLVLLHEEAEQMLRQLNKLTARLLKQTLKTDGAPAQIAA